MTVNIHKRTNVTSHNWFRDMSTPLEPDLLGILIFILNLPSICFLSSLLGKEEAFEALNIHHEWNRIAEIAI